MGIPMDSIHAPTVASGPTSGPSPRNEANRDDVPLMKLIQEKDRVEEELKALGGVLDSHGVNMNTSLTTFDGYPRDDIDVAQIRTTRARVIHLRNDYKDLMARIERGLHAHHASVAEAEKQRLNARGSSTNDDDDSMTSDLVETPFAKVNTVVSGSPAEQAGLKASDEIRRFGNITWMNHEKLSKIAETVQRNEGRMIRVKVSRRATEGHPAEELVLQLTPRSGWGGRGLLGCHLLPL
ncbi:MAG: hypothetical protein M1823_005300 [Watsoniomyces obsoletus]|nr:MAG: hypothetical protein M1823_005300 [Watsoniomyces obsoletus]